VYGLIYRLMYTHAGMVERLGGAGSRANSILVGSSCTLTKIDVTRAHTYFLFVTSAGGWDQARSINVLPFLLPVLNVKKRLNYNNDISCA